MGRRAADSKARAPVDPQFTPGLTKRRGRRVTMVDVAREAGCSQATVSFVLNGVDVKISPETRERVVKVARTMGYTASTFRALEQQQAPLSAAEGAIGFLVDQLATSPEAAIAIDSAHQEAWRTGRVLVSAQTGSDAVMEPK